MISHERRCIFIHIPKCAGTTVEDVLWPGKRSEADLWMGFISAYGNRYQTGGLQHLTASLVREAVGDRIFSQYLKFAVVRNPWDRAASQYAFMRRRGDLRAFIGMNESDDFPTYLRRIQKYRHVQWETQERFLCDEAGNLLVDEIIRFERFDLEFGAFLKRLGITKCIPHAKSGNRGPVGSLYDSETIEIVAKMYAGDIARFGYVFPGC